MKQGTKEKSGMWRWRWRWVNGATWKKNGAVVWGFRPVCFMLPVFYRFVVVFLIGLSTKKLDLVLGCLLARTRFLSRRGWLRFFGFALEARKPRYSLNGSWF